MLESLIPLQNTTVTPPSPPTLFFEWITPCLTLALVIVTAVMAWETRNVAKETLKVRLADYEPIIKTTLGWIGPVGISLKVQNVGKGVAKNITAKILLIGDKPSERDWFHPLLAPREFARLPLDSMYFKELATNFSSIKIEGECVDVLNHKHKISDTIDLKAVQKSIEGAPQLLETTLEEHIAELTSKVEEIDTDLKTVSKQMESGVVIMTHREAQKERIKRLRRGLRRAIALQKQRQKVQATKRAQAP